MLRLRLLPVFLVFSLPALAADKVTYVDHVLPIFRNACLNCHNPDKKKAGLDLTTYAATMAGSENGPVLKPGQADASLLFKVCAQTEEPKMPPKGDKLTDAELALLKNWIAGFALETGNSKPAQVQQNQVALAVVSLTRPDGPPPMPGDLPLEPFVRPRAATAVTAMAASPWAPLVAIGGQKQIVLWNTETLAPVGVLPYPEGFPQVIRFSRNGQMLLAGGGLGGKSGQVVLWNILTGQRAGSVGDEVDQVLAADLSPDQAHVALGGPGKKLKIYSTKDGKLLHTLKKHTEWVTAVTFSPDGKFLASADRNGGIMVWEGATGKEYNALPGHKAAVTALAFMPGVLASASADGKITLWDVKEAKESKSWTAHNGGVEWVDFTPDGRLVSCGRDKIAKVWDATGKLIFNCGEPFADIALRAALNSDRLIAADWTGRIRAFATDGKPLADLTANLPPIAEQLAAAQRRATEAQAGIPAAQQALADAEAKLAAERKTIEQRAKDTQTAIEQLKTAVPALEKAVADAKARREPTRAARDAAEQAVKAARKMVEEKEAAAASDLAAAKADLTAKTTAHHEAAKKAEEIDAQIAEAEARLKTAKAETPGKLSELDKVAKDTAAALAALGAEPPPSTAPATKLVTNDAQVAAAEKKLADLTAKIAERREYRARQSEGTAAYEKANEEVQALKPLIAAAEEEVAAAKNIQPTLVKAATPAPGAKPHPLIEAVSAAKAALAQAQAALAAAKVDVERWTRAQAFMAVHHAEQTHAELKAKHEDLVAGAKDALRPVEMAQAQVSALEKAVAEGPAKIKEAEAAVAAAVQARVAADKLVADTQALIVEKSKAADAAKVIEGEAAAATKKVMELTAEIERRRMERAKHAEGTPEYAKANEAVQSLKPELAAAEQAVATAKEKLAAAGQGPSPELAAAQETLKKAQQEAKLAADKVGPAEQALAKLKKSLEDGAAELSALKARLPEMARNARAAKAKAEQEAAALAPKVEAAKTAAQRARADFEAKWSRVAKM
jgi:predicted  nucleic acid-binding Zn-ribbon protein